VALDKLNSRRYRVHKQRVFDRDGRICRYCGSDEEPLHIDHIIPCAVFDMSDPAQQRECFNFSNLQPLWRADNLRKSNIRPDGTRARFASKNPNDY